MRLVSLCYIERDEQWLMLYRNKKKNDPNAGYYIGVGGKCEPRENIDACMLREAYEETGLTITGYERRGLIHFRSDVYEDEEMYLYTATEFTGTVTQSCPEGELSWVPKEEVLSLRIWEGDVYFLKRLLAGESQIEITLTYAHDRLIDVCEGDAKERNS